MTTFTNTTRTLALDPTTRGFAWALLEGSDTLVDWGTVHVVPPRNAGSLTRAATIMASYRPDVVVVEDAGAKGARRLPRAAALLRDFEDEAKRRKLRTRRIPRARVVAAFAPRTTKHEIALAIAERFPELRPRLPRVRKPWMSEDERMSIFDAVALALTFIWREAGPAEALPVISF